MFSAWRPARTYSSNICACCSRKLLRPGGYFTRPAGVTAPLRGDARLLRRDATAAEIATGSLLHRLGAPDGHPGTHRQARSLRRGQTRPQGPRKATAAVRERCWHCAPRRSVGEIAAALAQAARRSRRRRCGASSTPPRCPGFTAATTPAAAAPPPLTPSRPPPNHAGRPAPPSTVHTPRCCCCSPPSSNCTCTTCLPRRLPVDGRSAPGSLSPPCCCQMRAPPPRPSHLRAHRLRLALPRAVADRAALNHPHLSRSSAGTS